VGDGNHITPEGLEALKAELAELEGPRRQEIAERIRTAREWGDLKENAEYHDAKNAQGYLETRILRLSERLRNATVTEAPSGAEAEVRFGATVELRDEQSGRTVRYQLVGATEADLATGRLSADAPVAQALLGRRVGETVSVALPRGERRYTVLQIG
jgi:transcription elongation factor GreA